jgi:hypothetical protein
MKVLDLIKRWAGVAPPLPPVPPSLHVADFNAQADRLIEESDRLHRSAQSHAEQMDKFAEFVREVRGNPDKPKRGPRKKKP